MKKDEKNFIVEEIKKEKSGVKKDKSSFGLELELFIEVFIEALPMIMFLILIVYALNGLRIVLSDAEERKQTSVIETSDNSERERNGNSSDDFDFFWSYYYYILCNDY